MLEFPVMVLAELTDAELVARAGVESGAEEELCRRLGRRIRLYGLRHLRDEERAADLVQEVLLITLAGLREGKLREPEKLGSFVLGTCRLTVWNLRRGGTRQARLLENYRRTLPGAAPAVDAGVDRERLARCLAALPARERSVIVMSFYEERGGDELAGALDLSLENVRVIRHRALRRLRGCMEGAP